MNTLKKIVPVILILLLLTSCTPEELKRAARDKHAISAVLIQRMEDNDPNNDPTQEEKDSFIKATAKDWESIDKIVNKWKPDSTMGEIDLNKGIDNGKPESDPDR